MKTQNQNSVNPDTQSCQMVVSDSIETVLTSRVPIRFALNVDKYHKDFNIEVREISIYERDIMTVCVSGKMSNLIKLNKKCEEESYGDIDLD